MRFSTLPWRLCVVLSSSLLFLVESAQAAPSVNVALRASFDAAPYLVELLETAALENATSYFPLLDVIAEGTFLDVSTDKDLYERFSDILVKDGHMRDAEALSSFKFALSLHAAAPRIEAHFQYYNTSIGPGMMAAQDAACPVWVYLDGKQYCSPALDRAQQDITEDSGDVLPFDRVLAATPDIPSSILYADITHPLFGQFHDTVSKTARDGKSSYRVRYRPSKLAPTRPLYLNGYGVELVLKRTDYIVIDDRDESTPALESPDSGTVDGLNGDEESDLKPLTTSELASLGLNAASYIMGTSDPFDTLLKVSNNFPKYSSRIAAHNATDDFLTEYRANRDGFLPQGLNILWMNGLQVETRQINAFSLHENLARERKLINQMRELGLSASEAVRLLSHEVIAHAQVEDQPQRYDWRDEGEGADVIMWLNDIEQDKRYTGWPSELNALLQRTYPGQLPQVRRDIHNLIFPVDLANPKDLTMIVEILQNFVKRQVPVRIGLVPTLADPIALKNAQAAYHILEVYGLATLMQFFDELRSSKSPSTGEASFSAAIADREPREGHSFVAYEAVVQSPSFEERADHITAYLERLAIKGPNPPLFINGIAIAHSDNWLDVMSTRISLDLRTIQQGVYQGEIMDDTWVPMFFLFQAALRRNALVIPEDLKAIRVLDVSELSHMHAELFDGLPQLGGADATLLSDRLHMVLIADLATENGHHLLSEAMIAAERHPEVQILILDSTQPIVVPMLTSELHNVGKESSISLTREHVQSLLAEHGHADSVAEPEEQMTKNRLSAITLLNALGFAEGDNGIWLNGRLVGPIDVPFTSEDFETLLAFETTRRVIPVTTAITALGLEDKFTRPLDLAKLTALVSRAHKSDVPEGIYESSPLVRMDKFSVWESKFSAIKLSNTDDPTVQIVAAIDPASEIVQHWIPILKTLSELHGVDVKIFLNPRERILELPIKRFYRQVIQSAPVFDESGALATPKASFTKVPKDALLNLGMVVPPSWLVAPVECVYDLDNIKLSSLPKGQDVDAIYELENILIEGHSRELSKGPPPRGVQLLLGSEESPHFTDTLIMANLGYFQFKANPGYWHITLQPGRSSKIFHIDSVGAKGYAPQPNDETTSVALLSFQGATIFPRLSRNLGMEDEDVLESKDSTLDTLFSKGASFLGFASKSLTTSSSTKQADINIFSVASGHLYERMLSIMMLSVMSHTTHTVKFWFIEQFLSPSFKSFLPHLAAHYHFSFELVTYKWPHWLRAQKEKQREIWGYKILFLDVLFPLSLQKVIFVDADQVVRTDMMELNKIDLHGAPYGFTPMCDSRSEMEGFRFWKQGYWKNFLQGRPYHISALFVVDLVRFRELAAGDRLRQQYHQLSADPASLSNLDQDLPNHMQHSLPIHSLPQEWLWCETWCSDESLGVAKTIDLCNNPLTKEPKLERARRQLPEWSVYDGEVEELRRRVREREREGEKMEKETALGSGPGTKGRKEEL